MVDIYEPWLKKKDFLVYRMNNNKLKLTKEQEAQLEKNIKEIKKLIEFRQRKLPKDLKKVKDLAQFHIDPSTFVQDVLHGRVAIFKFINKAFLHPMLILSAWIKSAYHIIYSKT